MSETYPLDAELEALSGTSDPQQEVLYVPVGQSPYHVSFYKMQQRLLNVARRAGDLRVYKDGPLTFGVRAGSFMDGPVPRAFAGAAAQPLADNATSYIYLLPDATLAVGTAGFPDPSATPHIPLAAITTAGGAYSHSAIADHRGRSMFSVLAGVPADDLNALANGANADALHTHAATGLADSAISPAKLSAAAIDLLRYPRVGSSRTQQADAGTYIQALRLNSCSGVVRHVWIAAGIEGDPMVFNNGQIRVWYDDGEYSDEGAEPARAPDIIIPWGTLTGRHFPEMATPIGTITAAGLDADVSGGDTLTLSFRHAIPFGNGILVKVGWVDDLGNWTPNIYAFTWCQYELGPLPPAVADVRLKGRVTHGTATGPAGGTFTLVSEASGAGQMLAVFASIKGTMRGPGPYWIENNWQGKLDGSSVPNWETSGCEDLFGLESYAWRLGAISTPEWGCMATAAKTVGGVPYLSAESYRLFVSDPLRWDDGCVLQWPFAIGAEDVESAHQAVEMHALALYYHATA